MFSHHISHIYTEKQSLRTAFHSLSKKSPLRGAFGFNIQGEKSIKLVVSFSLTTALQFLRADRRGQPLFVAFSPALISAISFFISAISNARSFPISKYILTGPNAPIPKSDRYFPLTFSLPFQSTINSYSPAVSVFSPSGKITFAVVLEGMTILYVVLPFLLSHLLLTVP